MHKDREGQVALKLGRRPRKNQISAQLGARGELAEQARLADPRLAHQLDRRGRASVELIEQLLERIEVVGAPNEGVPLAP
jgi:hypothetical protein